MLIVFESINPESHCRKPSTKIRIVTILDKSLKLPKFKLQKTIY